MISSLTAGVSGMKNNQARMDLIGNNIANVSTVGFKASRSETAESFSQTLQQSTAGTDDLSGSSGIQIGTGVATTATRNLHTQGALTQTGVETDLAIDGNGMFVVRDTMSGDEFATRAGAFRIDNNGYMVTSSGHRLQGFTDAAGTTLGDLKLDTSTYADPTAKIATFSVAKDGKVKLGMSDGGTHTAGRVLLQRFASAETLMKAGENLYTNMDAAGKLDWATAPGLPGSGGLGQIQSGKLEMANVDLTSEFANLITTQRAFQANARMVSTSNDMIQEVVNLAR